jgi:hypothetical protein
VKKFLCVTILTLSIALYSKPKVTVVLVIDQFAAHYLPKLDPYLSHGIHKLLKNGIVYTNAHLPYAATSTGVGHASLGTGALPKDHGVIYNKWLDGNGNRIAPEDENGKFIMTPTLNDPFLASDKKNKSFSISLKPRATFGMAGKKGAATWFNENTSQFETNSNNMIIDKILKEWNKKLEHLNLTWNQMYSNEQFYQFPHINNYKYASEPSIINTSKDLSNPTKIAERLVKLPLANQILLDITEEYISKQLQMSPGSNLLVWVSLSSLDKIGHVYGPHSKEIIDMIYQLDKQIEQFMNKVNHIIPAEEILYVLTADHGVMPIPELIKKEYPQAQRLNENKIIKSINAQIKNTLGYQNAIVSLKIPHLVCNKQLMKELSKEKKQQLAHLIKDELKKIPGIKNAYPENELQSINPQEETPQWLLKNMIYPGRSGDILIELEPHIMISKHEAGTKHNNPQTEVTHVPLIMYQEGSIEKKVFSDKVWMPQLNSTVAEILEIPHASPQALQSLPIS